MPRIQGTRNEMKTYQSPKESLDGFLTTENKIVAKNCRLEDLSVTESILGGSWAPSTLAGIYNEKSVAGMRAIQLQAKCPDALKCVHVILSQIGSDVAARIDGAAYVSPKYHAGFDFPASVPVAAHADDNGYGIAKLYYTTSTIVSVMGIRTFSEMVDKFLSSQETVIARNVHLKELNITGAVLGGAWAQNIDAAAEFVNRSEAEMSVQLQAKCVDYLKCVHLILRQKGNDVTAQIDWAAATSSSMNERGFDFSQVTFVPIASNNGESGYGVSRLSFERRSLCKINTSVCAHRSTIQVKIRANHVKRNEIRIGLHWLNDDNSYPSISALIADKIPEDAGNGFFRAEFSFDEIAQNAVAAPKSPSKFFPVVFFTSDGSFDNAWFRTDLIGAQHTEGMIIDLPWRSFSVIKKKRDRLLEERREKEIKEAAYIYIDGNNFCWEDDRSRPKKKIGIQSGDRKRQVGADDRSRQKKRIGIARIDFILKKVNEESSRFPKATIRLFFDGGITHGYREAFLKRLNNGNVRVCDKKADKPMLDESEENGATERTFVVSADGFDEYTDYSVVRGSRLIRPELDNCTMRIPGLLTGSYDFNPDHFAHLPVRKVPFKGDVFIQAQSNGNFLCADDKRQSDAPPYARQIISNRSEPSEWETFILVQNDDGTISIKSKANGKYLTAMIDTDGHLMALAEKIDMWEKFWLTKSIKGPHYILRSHANMKYVTIYRDNGYVAAQADVAGEWEWLTINPCRRH